MNIIEFLKARLAEDEADARAAADVDGEYWHAVDPFSGDDYDRVEGSGDTAVGYDMYSGTCPHVARHDPARVLREIAAKRRIVEDYRISRSAALDQPDSRGTLHAGAEAFHSACLTLASAYSDHPDYTPSWTE